MLLYFESQFLDLVFISSLLEPISHATTMIKWSFHVIFVKIKAFCLDSNEISFEQKVRWLLDLSSSAQVQWNYKEAL